MRAAYTRSEIATALGVAPSTIFRRAVAEQWVVVGKNSGPGGGVMHGLQTLPPDIRSSITAFEARQALATTEAAPKSSASAPVGKQLDKALARIDLVNLYVKHIGKAKSKKKAVARESFMAAYSAGVWPQLLEILGPTSWKSIERWKVQMRAAEDPLGAVTDRRGGQTKGQRMLSPETQQVVLAKALHPHAFTISEVARHAQSVLKTLGHSDEIIPSERTIRRYLLDWKELHNDEWVFMRQGRKAWNDLCCFVIERDYDLIEVGDIAVADGHKLNFEITNPWTGKTQRMTLVLWYDMKSNYPMGWDIMPSEDTQTIASALRRAILCLGKVPRVAYLDNGKAFRSKFFTGVRDFKQSGLGGLFQTVGVETLFAWPYHGQSKPIERFFKTFSEFERLTPSYSGTSIETKPPRMHRDEKLHKQIYAASGGRPLTLSEAHQAVAYWFDMYVRRPQRGHLKGKTPLEVFQAGRGEGVNPDALNKLMMAKEIKTISNNSIQFQGERYYSPLLYNRKHKVLIRYDLQDLEAIHVYTVDGAEEICVATKQRKIHPVAKIMGDAEQQQALEDAIAIKKRQEKQAGTTAREMLENIVMPEHELRMAKIQESKPASKAVEKEPTPLSQSKIKSIEEVKAKARAKQAAAPAYTPPGAVRDIRNEMEKYEYLFKVREKSRLTLTEQDAAWMAHYETTNEYFVNKRRYEQLLTLYTRQRELAAMG